MDRADIDRLVIPRPTRFGATCSALDAAESLALARVKEERARMRSNSAKKLKNRRETATKDG